MEKRKLSAIPREEATKDMLEAAGTLKGMTHIVTAKLIENNKILLLNFYKITTLIKGKTGAAFRTFMSNDDYITQDLSVSKVKWKTASFCMMDNFSLWKNYWDMKANKWKQKELIFIRSEEEQKIISDFFSAYDTKIVKVVPWDRVYAFQEKVKNRRVAERHKRETDKIDKKMEIVPKEPKGFHNWMHDKAMADKRYLIYKTGMKRYLTGYCTSCKKEIKIDTKVNKPRNKQHGKCPVCGSEVTFIPKGYFPKYKRDSKWVCLVQRVQSGIVTRYFYANLEIQRDNEFKEFFSIGELYRVFYEEDKKELKRDAYEWDVYKQRGPCRWCPIDTISLHNAVLYTENLPQEFIGTIFQYCAADLYQKKKGCEPIPIFKYLEHYPTNKYLEYFVKVGLLNLTNDVLTKYVYSLNTSGKTPTEILDMPKEYIKTLAEIDGTGGEYLLLKQCAADKVIPNAKDIQQYHKRFGGNDEMLGVINTHMRIGEFVRYMDKQKKKLMNQKEDSCCHMGTMYRIYYSEEEKEREEYKNLGHDWMDYISWCTELKYDMQDKYTLLPPDLKKAHDRVMKEYQAHKDELERKKLAELERQMKKILREAKNYAAMEMKTKKLMIVAPRNGEDIRAEGRILHHCVGSYVERVAKGETMILFVRKVDEPEKPYFTLEYKNGKVIQCRGKKNCSMSEDVQAFVQAFEKKMQKEIHDRNKNDNPRKVS